MKSVFVQFSGPDELVVTGVFCGPQDPEVWGNQGQIDADDPRYLAFMTPQSTPEVILKAKQYQKDALLLAASQAMPPLFLALQLGDATDAETVAAKAWRDYYTALQTVDITVDSPHWPIAPSSP